jgi:hypothetical protein
MAQIKVGGSPARGEAGVRGARGTKNLRSGAGPGFVRPPPGAFADGRVRTNENGVVLDVGAYNDPAQGLAPTRDKPADGAVSGSISFDGFTDGMTRRRGQ